MAMAGTYTLTLDLDDSCSVFPAPTRQRVYRVTLEDYGWHFLVVKIVGGGFSAPEPIGDLFSGDLSPFQHVDAQLRWNSSDSAAAACAAVAGDPPRHCRLSGQAGGL